MAPLNPLDTWSVRPSSPEQQPKAKCFLVGEGANTEFWYFQSLTSRLAREGKPKLIELKPVERTGEHRNQSSPRRLFEHAKEIRKDEHGIYGFEPDSDSIVIIFDADVYAGMPEEYAADLERFSGVARVAVTYPSFEVFLLLHAEGGYDRLIRPNIEHLAANERIGKNRRFAEKLVSDEFGINPKSNPAIGELSQDFDRAIKEEEKINQDPTVAIGVVSSNIGKVLVDFIDDRMWQDREDMKAISLTDHRVR